MAAREASLGLATAGLLVCACTTGSGAERCDGPAVHQCGADGHVHWFDSCGTEGAIVATCPPGELCRMAGGAASCAVAEQADFYVSPRGDDAGPGTLAQPFRTLEQAFAQATPGTLIYVRGGTYTPEVTTRAFGFRLSGRAGAPGESIKVWAYPGETPVLDCSGMTYDADSMFCLLVDTNVHHAHVKGFEVKGLPQLRDAQGRGHYEAGILVRGTSCIVEGVTVHHIGGSGINVAGAGNTLLNDDIHDCYDPYTYDGSGAPYPGGNADGVHITISGTSPTPATVVSGCRMWNNSDDGIDTFDTDGMVEIADTWVWHNGYLSGTNTPAGDGEGVKLGRTVGSYGDVRRNVHGCVAVANRTAGFSANGGLCGMSIHDNTAFQNGEIQFSFGQDAPNVTLRNNLAYGASLAYVAHATHDHNSWDSPGVAVDVDDFASLDQTQLGRPRKPDGSLPAIDFLHLAPGSELRGAGVDVGQGTDLGAF